MTNEQKQYIENNIHLIENNEWEKFFTKAPDGMGEVLYNAGLDFMSAMHSAPDNAFVSSKLTSITIPNGVTNIGDYAFFYCKSLISITIPDSVKSIGNHAFACCDSLTSITIPKGVINIGDSAFTICDSLTSITISDSVTSIGEDAFSDCFSLKKLAFAGSMEDWQHVSLKTRAFTNVPARTIKCTDGTTRLRH